MNQLVRGALVKFGNERLGDYTDIWYELLEEAYLEGTADVIILRRDFVRNPEKAFALQKAMKDAYENDTDCKYDTPYDAYYGPEWDDITECAILADLNGLQFVKVEELTEEDIILLTMAEVEESL